MRRALPLLLVLVAAGCSGGDDNSSSTTSASSVNGGALVLSRADVGKSYFQYDKGEQNASDFTPPRDDPKRDGRIGGWKTRFSRTGSEKPGPLVIASLADVFEDDEGARKDFELYGEALEQFKSTGGKDVAVPGLGDEARGVTYKLGRGPSAVRYYVVAWRDGAVTASLTVYGSTLTAQQVLDLARKQEARIRSAS